MIALGRTSVSVQTKIGPEALGTSWQLALDILRKIKNESVSAERWLNVLQRQESAIQSPVSGDQAMAMATASQAWTFMFTEDDLAILGDLDRIGPSFFNA